MITIRETEKMGKPFEFAMSVFLEDFKHNKDYKAFEEEPVGNVFSKEQYVLIAAMVEKLSNDNNLEKPKWISNSKYYLSKPFYELDINDDEYKKWIVNESPAEYRSRNVFVSNNSLDRY